MYAAFAQVVAQRRSKILYRVVDEYPEYGEWEISPRSSSRPLTFRKLIRLIDTAVSPLVDRKAVGNDLTDAMREGASDDWEFAARFVTVSSYFYPGLEEYYDRKAELWLEERRAKWADDEDEDDETVSDEDEIDQYL